MYDVAIIGAGASGLAAAIRLKQNHPGLNIVLLEQLDRVGKKLITTGNGRCNITNKNVSPQKYHSQNIDFAEKILEKYGVSDTVDFFSKIGVQIVFEPDGRAYPASYQASAVVDAMRFFCEEEGVTVINGFALKNMNFGDVITIDGGRKITAKAVLIATGLYSGGDKIGSDGSVFKMLQNFGCKAQKTSPSIVQLKTENTLTRQLKGIKVNANATICVGEQSRSEFGEVLFTDYGLSGPPILQISRLAASGGDKKVYLDLLPDYSAQQLGILLAERRNNLAKRKAENFLVGLINKKLSVVLLKSIGINLQANVGELTDSELGKIIDALKNLCFPVLGTTGYINSQVTAGGISLTEIGFDMQSKKHKGVFLSGEILDVDGDCGGYNLQWAWSSAFAAAEGIAGYLGE